MSDDQTQSSTDHENARPNGTLFMSDDQTQISTDHENARPNGLLLQCP